LVDQSLFLWRLQVAKKETIFWDVDTQFDFLMPRGRLHVPTAERIIGNISSVRRFALKHGYSIVASMDWHSPEDDEISETPDFKETFPAHCIADQPGSERVGYLGEIPIEYVPTEKLPVAQLEELVRKGQFHIVIRKNTVDVFDNPNTVELLNIVRPRTVVVFGVTTDVCVYTSVRGLLKWGRCGIAVIKDAVKGVGIRTHEEVFEQLGQQGVKVIHVADVLKEF
jgi:nicotinamidase/pyrazinamidase